MVVSISIYALSTTTFNMACQISHLLIGSRNVLRLCAGEDESVMTVLKLRNMDIEDLGDVVAQLLLLREDSTYS